MEVFFTLILYIYGDLLYVCMYVCMYVIFRMIAIGLVSGNGIIKINLLLRAFPVVRQHVQ